MDANPRSTHRLRTSEQGGYGQAQSSIRPLLIVVSDVNAEDSLKVSRPVDQDVVETFSAQRPYEPFREGARPRCADWDSDDPARCTRRVVPSRFGAVASAQ